MNARFEECKPLVEEQLGALEWGRVDADNQVHVCWPAKGSWGFHLDHSVSKAARTVKAALDRRGAKPLVASLGVETVKAEHTALTQGETVVVLRVAYA